MLSRMLKFVFIFVLFFLIFFTITFHIQLQPHQCLPFINEHILKKQKSKDKKSKQQQSLPKPGNESIRSNREDKMNKLVKSGFNNFFVLNILF